MPTNEQLEAATYLGIPQEQAEAIPDGLVAAVTATDLGLVPPQWIERGFDALTVDDQDAVLRFARFLQAVGARKEAPSDAQ